MQLITRGWLERGSDRLLPGDRTGANVAHTLLLETVLSAGLVDSLVILTEQANPPTAGVQQLLTRFGSKTVQVLTPEQIRSSGNKCDSSILLGSGPELPYFAAAREFLGLRNTPICCMLHAVKWDFSFAAYTQMMLLCRSSDSLVVSSTAGMRAVNSIITEITAAISIQNYSSPSLVQIPLGVRLPATVRLDKTLARRQLHLPDQAQVILYLGRLTRLAKADLDPLLLSFTLLHQVHPDSVLVLAGAKDNGDDYLEEIERLCRAYGVRRNVHLMPDLPPDNKQFIYAAADIFTSPSDNVQETFGLAVVEAMMNRLPVVISSWSGYRDLITDGAEGYLIPTYWDREFASSEANFGVFAPRRNVDGSIAARTVVDVEIMTARLSGLLSSPEECTRMGEAAHKKAAAYFDVEKVARAYRALWQKQLCDAREEKRWKQETREPRFSHDSIFSHYADISITKATHVTLSYHHADISILLDRSLAASHNEKLREGLNRMSKLEYGVTRSVDSLISEGVDYEIVIWMMKRGLLKIL